MPPGHPERPERLAAIDAALEALEQKPQAVSPRGATDDEILRTHSREHLGQLGLARGQVFQFDADTSSGPQSVDVARLAAGSTVELALGVARGDYQRGFAMVRPPGHHAERGAAMGFCLLNQVAMAVHALRAELGLERIAVVDFDVHHGNGTQHILEGDRDALFVSTHQFPFYPGTGALREQGLDAGLGSTVNLPLPAGCGDAEYQLAFETVALPVLREFKPEILLVSAGFDAHAADPLAAMKVSTAGFRWITSALREVADDCCGGRMVLSLEGGYDLDALAESVATTVEMLCADPTPALSQGSEVAAGAVDVDSFRQAHGRYWSSVRAKSS